MADATPTSPDETPLISRLLAPTNRLTWIAAGALLIVLTVWLFLTPAGILGKADAIGYAVCHRITIRSFAFPDGRQLPLCARCSGTFLGVLVGMFGPGLIFRRRRAAMFPPIALLLALVGFSALWAFDGANSYTFLLEASGLQVPHLYMPSNLLRVITGMGHGITMGSLLLPVFNSMLWADPQPERTLKSIWELLALLGIGGLMVGAILSGLGVFLYPLAVLSSLGVVAVLGGIGTVVAATILRRDNQSRTLADALPLILLGLTLALAMIGVIDAMRYLATGTWDAAFISPRV